jgi:flagellar biosynthesis chaperone FliJ
MALAVEELLSLWREAERVLERLPADDPKRVVVSAEVVNLRRMYRRLTEERDLTAVTIAESRLTLDEAHRVLAEARQHLSP